MVNVSICEKMIENSPDMQCAINSEGEFIRVSDACRFLLGYESSELEGKPYADLVHPDDLVLTNRVAIKIQKGQPITSFQNRYIRKDGQIVPVLWSVNWSAEDQIYYCTARDATERLNLHKSVHEKEAFYKALIEHGSDMMGLLDESGNYLFVSDATTRILGYAPEQLIGLNAFNLIHPDDLEAVVENWVRFENQPLIKTPDFRFKSATGEWRWIESIISNQLHNPAIRAFVVSSRDITERKTGRLKLEESEQRYRSLFENNPDIVIFEDTRGIVTEVNKAFRETFGPASESIIGKPASSFLSPDMATVNKLSLHQALMGSTPRFDLELTLPGNKQKILDTVKFPVTVAGEVVGALTIFKDITPIVRSFDTIERQAKKLNTIFESITDAFFTLDKDWCYTYVNSEFERITGNKKSDCVGKHLLEVSEYGTLDPFFQQYLHAVKTGKSVHFEAYSNRLTKWFEVKAFPSDEGLSVYFSDITARIDAQQEVEKLSLVANYTDNGVIITDSSGKTEWVNEGFTRMTGYTLSEMAGKKPGAVLQGPDTSPETVKEVSQKLKNGEHFNATLLNYKRTGEEFWVSIDLTPISDNTGIVSRYIAILKDISFRKEAEENLLSLTQDLYLQNKNLQEFTYIVSHNLRAPVANALGLANLLKKADKDSEMFQASLSHLKTSVLKMDTVLRDVNMILTIRNKQDVLEIEDVKLSDVFRQAYMQLQEPLLRCGGEITLDFPDELTVRANRAYLFNIFYNLLSNSIKFRSEERLLQVRLEYLETVDGIKTISFSDNGKGFDVDKAGDEVFKLYKRFHKDKKGRGMGLFLVKAHVEAMGWQIKVESQENKGTQFLIYLNQN